MRTKAIVGLMVLGVTIFLVSTSSMAYFHDTEIGKNNFFGVGTWGGTETAWAGSVDTPELNPPGWENFGKGWGGYFPYNPEEGATLVPLIAGRHIPVGELFIEFNDADNTLLVEFWPDENFYLTETHLYVGTEIPDTSAPGQFTYKHEELSEGTDYDIYEISLGTNPENQYIAAHAVVYSDNW